MKKLTALIIAALAIFGATAAHATTDCVGTVGWIEVDAPGTSSGYFYVVVDTGAGVGMTFAFPAADANAAADATLKALYNSASLAMSTGKTVTVRLAASSGVDCANSTYPLRTDVVGFFNLGGR